MGDLWDRFGLMDVWVPNGVGPRQPGAADASADADDPDPDRSALSADETHAQVVDVNGLLRSGVLFKSRRTGRLHLAELGYSLSPDWISDENAARPPMRFDPPERPVAWKASAATWAIRYPTEAAASDAGVGLDARLSALSFGALVVPADFGGGIIEYVSDDALPRGIQRIARESGEVLALPLPAHGWVSDDWRDGTLRRSVRRTTHLTVTSDGRVVEPTWFPAEDGPRFGESQRRALLDTGRLAVAV